MVLLEDNVLMSPLAENSPPSLIPVRVETLSPSTDWSQAWKLVRTRGLGSDLSSFLFKLLHCLLPTQDRVSRLGASENRGFCQLCNMEVEDPLHAFFTCQHSQVPGHALLGYLQTAVPNLTPEGALKLQFETSLNDDQLLASVCLLSSGLSFIWERRILKKQVSIFTMRAEIEAKISILRKTRHSNAAVLMVEMLQ